MLRSQNLYDATAGLSAALARSLIVAPQIPKCTSWWHWRLRRALTGIQQALFSKLEWASFKPQLSPARYTLFTSQYFWSTLCKVFLFSTAFSNGDVPSRNIIGSITDGGLLSDASDDNHFVNFKMACKNFLSLRNFTEQCPSWYNA